FALHVRLHGELGQPPARRGLGSQAELGWSSIEVGGTFMRPSALALGTPRVFSGSARRIGVSVCRTGRPFCRDCLPRCFPGRRFLNLLFARPANIPHAPVLLSHSPLFSKNRGMRVEHRPTNSFVCSLALLLACRTPHQPSRSVAASNEPR